MKRKYEIVYIFDSALEEPEVNEHLDRFHELLKTPEQAEPITGLAHWGKRTLAYPIMKKEVGYYVVAHFETDTTLLNEFERIIKLDDTVLRYLVVINEGLPATRIDHPEPEETGAEKAEKTESEAAPDADAKPVTDGDAPTQVTEEAPEAEKKAAPEPTASTEEAPKAEKAVQEPTASTEEGGE